MVSLVVGLVMVCFTVFAALPPETVGFGLGWGKDIILFLRGGFPIFLAFAGLIAVFIGIADIKDKQDAKKEKEAMESVEMKA